MPFRARNFRKSTRLIILSLLMIIITLEFFGVFVRLFEKDFYTDFHYPMDEDITEFILQLRAKQKPSVPPINAYNYSFISNCEYKCKNMDTLERLHLVHIVKSAAEHFERRRAIRNSWGYEYHFANVSIRTVFVLGVRQMPSKLQAKINVEQIQYRDIVQANFWDSYFNNTIKTMVGFTWAVTYCPLSKFYMFSDDDVYISTRNVLNFLQDPAHYPIDVEIPYHISRQKRLIKTNSSISASLAEKHSEDNLPTKNLRQHFDFDSDEKLFTGFVFTSSPHRHWVSKWYVPLWEYPYHMWPPYVAPGAYIVCRDALLDMHYASYYTKHFRFEEIYLGLLAKKAGIVPLHSAEFHVLKESGDLPVSYYRYVLASCGFSHPGLLTQVWKEQNALETGDFILKEQRDSLTLFPTRGRV